MLFNWGKKKLKWTTSLVISCTRPSTVWKMHGPMWLASSGNPPISRRPLIDEGDAAPFLLVVLAGNLDFIPQFFEGGSEQALIQAILARTVQGTWPAERPDCGPHRQGPQRMVNFQPPLQEDLERHGPRRLPRLRAQRLSGGVLPLPQRAQPPVPHANGGAAPALSSGTGPPSRSNTACRCRPWAPAV